MNKFEEIRARLNAHIHNQVILDDIMRLIGDYANERYDEGYTVGENQGYMIGHEQGYDSGWGSGYNQDF